MDRKKRAKAPRLQGFCEYRYRDSKPVLPFEPVSCPGGPQCGRGFACSDQYFSLCNLRAFDGAHSEHLLIVRPTRNWAAWRERRASSPGVRAAKWQ